MSLTVTKSDLRRAACISYPTASAWLRGLPRVRRVDGFHYALADVLVVLRQHRRAEAIGELVHLAELRRSGVPASTLSHRVSTRSDLPETHAPILHFPAPEVTT